MTSKEKKEWLSRYLQAAGIVDSLSEAIARVQSNAEKITPSLSLAPAHSESSVSSLQKSVEQLEKLQDNMLEATQRLRIAQVEVMQAINSVSNPTYRQILTFRYINGYSWDKIASKMHYSYRSVTRLHGAALNVVLECPTETCYNSIVEE